MNRQQQINASKKASQVYDLKVRGWRTSEIAASLGIGERQVRWLVQEGDRLTDGRIRSLSRDGALRQLLLAHEARERKLWDIFTTARLELTKVACLRQLVDEEKKFETLLERMKVLTPPPATPLDINLNERKELRIAIDVRYSDAELGARVPDLLGRLRGDRAGLRAAAA